MKQWSNFVRIRKFYKMYNETQSSITLAKQTDISIDDKFDKLNTEFKNLKIEIEQNTK